MIDAESQNTKWHEKAMVALVQLGEKKISQDCEHDIATLSCAKILLILKWTD